jgi:general secretion pathway protein G
MRSLHENRRDRACRGQAAGRNLGFTLIELMLVLVILATLAGLVAPRFMGYGQKAKKQAAQTQIQSNFVTALDTFEVKVGRYPSTAEGLNALVQKPTNDPGDWDVPIMPKIPLDPWKNPYQYVYPGTNNVDSYDLWSYGPDGKLGGGDDITNWDDENTAKN